MVTTLSSFRASGSGPTGEHAAPPAAVAYRERPPPAALAPWVRCTWELTVGQGADRDGLVLPDGCQDIVLLAGGLLVAGPDTGPAPVNRVAGETVVGVRFHPGAAPPLLGPAASELLDTRVPLDGVWGRRGRELEERAAEAASPAAGLAVVEAALVAAAGGARRPDPLVAAAVARLERGPAAPGRVAGIGPAIGLGERQLRRRFLAAVGYGPKTLARILRFQRLLALLDGDPATRPSLALAAAEAGYADQAHMSAECVRLAARTPGALLLRPR
jgi:AraC-like DNA-binding protein